MSLESFTPTQRREIESFVSKKLSGVFAAHLRAMHPYQIPHQQTTSGTPSLDVKPDTPTTPPSTPETDTTVLSNLVKALGEVLAAWDSPIITLTTLRENLQSAYNNALAGASGLVVPASLSSDPLNNAPEQGTSGGKAQWRCHCGDTSGCRPGHCLNVPA